MRPINFVALCGLAAALFVGASVQAADAPAALAQVKAVKGDVQFTTKQGGEWKALTNNTVLAAGAFIKTGAKGEVTLAVQDTSKIIRLGENTAASLEKLSSVGKDSDTVINITKGALYGDIKKLSKNSHFDIRTPNGVAGIRGTTFSVTVGDNGAVSIICGEGQVVYVGEVNGVKYELTVENGQAVLLVNGSRVPAVESAPSSGLSTLTFQVGEIKVYVTANPTPIGTTGGTGSDNGTGGNGEGNPTNPTNPNNPIISPAQ